MWGHDLRVEGIVVEPLDGLDHLAAAVAGYEGFAPRGFDLLGTGPGHAVLLNAGAALALVAQYERGNLFGGADDLASGIRAGMTRAAEAVDSGAAQRTLDVWIHGSSAVDADSEPLMKETR